MKRRPSRRIGLRLLLFLVVGAGWTLFAMYPNPAVFVRNIQRYRKLPLDPRIEQRMGWDLPPNAAGIEFFVNSLILPTPDWETYRVPWYVPTAAEAARATHGDCETKAVLLASLLAGKKLPYEIRASFNHIWVDYPGRKAQPGESAETAYLQGKGPRLHLRWPGRLAWGEFLHAQQQQLWSPMPPLRKLIWLLGLGWALVGTLTLGGQLAESDLASQWRVPLRAYLGRAFVTAFFLLVGAIALPSYLHRNDHLQWRVADLCELAAATALSGAFIAWLEMIRSRRGVVVDLRGPGVTVHSALGIWRHTRGLEGERIRHLELTRGSMDAWTVAAILRTGEPVALVRYSSELLARAALKHLGRKLMKPVAIRSEGREYWTAPDEMPLNLRARAAHRPAQEPITKPADTFLLQEPRDDMWVLGYPAQGRGGARLLLSLSAMVIAFSAMATALVVYSPGSVAVRIIWVGAAMILGLAAYTGMSLREELLAGLAGARVEIAEGNLTYHDADGRTQTLPLDTIESVEIGRAAEARTIAIVSPDRVIHIRFYVSLNHLEWARREIKAAIARL